MSAFRFERYSAPAGPELVVRRGPRSGPALLVIPPLLEEAQFARTLIAAILARLAERGVRSWLPDLPGLGESLVPIAAVRLANWRSAAAAAFAHVAAAAGTTPLVATVRAGALLTPGLGARGLWRLAPCDGAELLRPLRRAQAVARTHDMAGWALSPELVADLDAASLAAVEAHDVAWTDGTPPWRRAEPAAPADAVATLAADLDAWIDTCVAR